MAFAAHVKSEILENIPLRKHHKLAMGYGLLLCAKHFSVQEMTLTTERKEIARLYSGFITDVIGVLGVITTTETGIGEHSRHYTVSVESAEDRARIWDFFAQREGCINTALLAGEGDPAAFVSGAFLACGTVTDPEKNYMIEFALYNPHMLEAFAELLTQVIGPPKFALKRGVGVLYYRESEQIEDALTAMGASRGALQMMEVKIVKEMRNKVNRVTNCETANIDKTVAAAAEHISSIQYLMERLGPEGLPEELREVAQLRLAFPELSLRELAEQLSTPMSRSGVNHRLRKLCQMAEELRSHSEASER